MTSCFRGNLLRQTGRGIQFAAFLAFAQRAFCAAAIRAFPSADMVRFLGLAALMGLPGLRFTSDPLRSALACCRRAISASISESNLENSIGKVYNIGAGI